MEQKLAEAISGEGKTVEKVFFPIRLHIRYFNIAAVLQKMVQRIRDIDNQNILGGIAAAKHINGGIENHRYGISLCPLRFLRQLDIKGGITGDGFSLLLFIHRFYSLCLFQSFFYHDRLADRINQATQIFHGRHGELI